MYEKEIFHKNFLGKNRTQTVRFNLTEHEFLKLLVEFKAIFDWQERLSLLNPDAETDTAEVVEFYNNFEEIVLAAWGEPDESGDYFRKSKVWEFRESSLFHATMKMFLENQVERDKFLETLTPPGLKDIVEKADESLLELSKREGLSPEAKERIAALRAQYESEVQKIEGE